MADEFVESHDEQDYAYLHDAIDEVLYRMRDDQLNLASEACRNTIRDAILERIINDLEEEELSNG